MLLRDDEDYRFLHREEPNQLGSSRLGRRPRDDAELDEAVEKETQHDLMCAGPRQPLQLRLLCQRTRHRRSNETSRERTE